MKGVILDEEHLLSIINSGYLFPLFYKESVYNLLHQFIILFDYYHNMLFVLLADFANSRMFIKAQSIL